jgi:hypothetical protein
MLDKLQGKKVFVALNSKSGAGVDNGSHGARTSVSSIIYIEGQVETFDDTWVSLINTKTTTLAQFSLNSGFNSSDNVISKQSEFTLISIQNILYINLI